MGALSLWTAHAQVQCTGLRLALFEVHMYELLKHHLRVQMLVAHASSSAINCSLPIALLPT